MKLIIDIPDHEYRQIKEIYEKNDIVESTYSYIYHGTPLDDVKAEIEEKISHYDHFSSSNTAHGLNMALAIIDKHISGKE